MGRHSIVSFAREDTEAIDFLICRVRSVLADTLPLLDLRQENGKDGRPSCVVVRWFRETTWRHDSYASQLKHFAHVILPVVTQEVL